MARMLTEEEAKTKCCCGPDSAGAWIPYPPIRGEPQRRVCIASQCMAWRWGTKPSKWQHITGNIYTPVWDADDLKAGFCGLAGKIEP